jgi:multiple sugar transport system permease protein
LAARVAGVLRRTREPGIRGHEAVAGWVFLLPVIAILGVFLVIPIAMAAWVSFSDWNGNGSPLGAHAHWIGLANYRDLLTTPGLDQNNFGEALRNNLYYVLLVVPIQTAVSLFLAVLVSRRLKAVGFFRTAFYFPSVTSSVAITVLFLFLFSPTGVINKLLSYVGASGPAWLYDPDGLFHVIAQQFGANPSGGHLANHVFLGVTYWDWLAGPSVAMCVFIIMAVFTTSGTFMLLFLAGLQGIDESVNEAAALDGASEWKKFRHITVPMIRPTLFTVVTLGLIGTWQIFDQIYVGTKGSPLNTTMTPAYLSFDSSFNQNEWGVGAAIAFILFAIIVFFTLFTRLLTRNPDKVPRRRRFAPAGPIGDPKISKVAGSAP